MVLSRYWPIESCLKFSNQSHVVAQAGKIMGIRYNKCRSGVVLEQTYWNTQRRKCFVHWKKCQTANKEDSYCGLTIQLRRVNVLCEQNSLQRDSNGLTAHFSLELFCQLLCDILMIAWFFLFLNILLSGAGLIIFFIEKFALMNQWLCMKNANFRFVVLSKFYQL